MPYQYKMVQVPAAISVSGSERGTEAASYLESLATGQASQGWDFYRVDTIGVLVEPGWLASHLRTPTGGILGKEPSFSQYFVVTFRKDQ